ncbi:MAG: hypothetical protein Q4G68_01785 [Planctomycetia bacterium]|nr:hypothetical protein [Planctomycetia bacterium]
MKRYVTRIISLFTAFLVTLTSVGAQTQIEVQFAARNMIPSYGSVSGVWYYADQSGPTQLLLLGHNQCGADQQPRWQAVLSFTKSEPITLTFTFSEPVPKELQLQWADANKIEFSSSGTSLAPTDNVIHVPVNEGKAIVTLNAQQDTVAELNRMANLFADGSATPVALTPQRRPYPTGEFISFPDPCPALSEALICWDWQMHDGVNAPREARTWYQATEKQLTRGRLLLNDLIEHQLLRGDLENFQKQWTDLELQFTKVEPENEEATHTLWRNVHQVKRNLLLNCEFFTASPLLFAKHVPSAMSHQLTQVYGYCARPGGGLFLLSHPGKDMQTTCLTNDMPIGNYMHPVTSYDGQSIFFSFCEVSESPKLWPDTNVLDRVYQIYRMKSDGSGITRLTNDAYDNFSPLELPDGDLIFSSTRRGGFHRCGRGPCPVYTLSRMKPDGSDPHSISFHETHEWNPTLTHDGRILYTRWDYVDRDAVHYQNLWSARQDGTDVRIYYGNNSVQVAGLWEAKSIPDSNRVMAVAGPHHGMSAGSVVLIDTEKGVDGEEAVSRITPEVLFPEAESPLPLVPYFPVATEFDTPLDKHWKSRWNPQPEIFPEEQLRWPAHHFKSPWPYSEKYFLASYSFDRLVGEAGPNIPNQYGIYLCDAFGNRELLYRDPNLSSVWAMPLEPRPIPPAYSSTLPERATAPDTGQFFLQNVYESWPYKIPDTVHALRIVEVLKKTTPNANQPTVGVPNASPGKRVLGTVPVEEDGSAWFELPAETPLLFQALDKQGRMIQGMRSLVYLQKGETASCTGCHEDRLSSVPVAATIASRSDRPAQLTPGPDGSNPFSYPLLVQPVLDRLCVSCHNPEKPESKLDLTDVPDGLYTKSYNALIPFVSFSAWGLPNDNYEPRTEPDRFGTRGSQLTKILEAGHYDCQLTEDDWQRLTTWMDVNALFYGTFDVELQSRQRAGERLAPEDVE